MIMNIQISQITRGQWSSDDGIMVIIADFQTVDPGSVPSHRILNLSIVANVYIPDYEHLVK
jgi:hypothetical protein